MCMKSVADSRGRGGRPPSPYWLEASQKWWNFAQNASFLPKIYRIFLGTRWHPQHFRSPYSQVLDPPLYEIFSIKCRFERPKFRPNTFKGACTRKHIKKGCPFKMRFWPHEQQRLRETDSAIWRMWMNEWKLAYCVQCQLLVSVSLDFLQWAFKCASLSRILLRISWVFLFIIHNKSKDKSNVEFRWKMCKWNVI